LADHAQSVQVLIDLVNSDTAAHSLQVAAIEGLGHAAGRESRAFLISLLADEERTFNLKVEAARALGRACRPQP